MKNLYTLWLRVTLVLGLMIAASALYAQKSVSGTVLDEAGSPIPGVSILEKGTTNGTTTDTEGKYNLTVRGENPVLTFSFIGYKTQEVSVDNRTSVAISLDPDVSSLEEVVVTGYTTERKQDIVAAVSTL